MNTLTHLKELAGKAIHCPSHERPGNKLALFAELSPQTVVQLIEVIEQCQGALNAAQTRVCNASVDKALQSIKDFGKE